MPLSGLDLLHHYILITNEDSNSNTTEIMYICSSNDLWEPYWFISMKYFNNFNHLFVQPYLRFQAFSWVGKVINYSIRYVKPDQEKTQDVPAFSSGNRWVSLFLTTVLSIGFTGSSASMTIKRPRTRSNGFQPYYFSVDRSFYQIWPYPTRTWCCLDGCQHFQ